MPTARTGVDVEPLGEVNGELMPVLESVRSLQRAWKAAVSWNDAAFHETRRRSLRRHAIETGIIERLYDLDWGVTRALVAEGLTADGGVEPEVQNLLLSQYGALEFMAEVAREGRPLTVSLIRQLYVALTRPQKTFTATAPTGQRFQATLHHGEWKTQPNHVVRPDGSILEYTPPEQVAPQMERLVELYHSYEDVDPIIREAWLHHRFVRIHPFEDGNGRVARCLTLLGLLRHDLAPLVVDRRERDRYLRCLDDANAGDLRPLIRFFAELEIVALRSELEQPATAEAAATAQGAVAVLDAGIQRLRDLRGVSGAAERGRLVSALADGVLERVVAWLRRMAGTIETRLRDIDPNARADVVSAAPPDERSRWWRRQVFEAANSVDFYANIHSGVWWARLRVTALGQTLRYLVFLQKVGRGETGVLSLTVYGETLGPPAGVEEGPQSDVAVVSTPTETVTWTYTDSVDTSWELVEEVLDATLAQAIARFTVALG
ncbi:MAG: Fic family protein [Micromonosporaceae bacterium]